MLPNSTLGKTKKKNPNKSSETAFIGRGQLEFILCVLFKLYNESLALYGNSFKMGDLILPQFNCFPSLSGNTEPLF